MSIGRNFLLKSGSNNLDSLEISTSFKTNPVKITEDNFAIRNVWSDLGSFSGSYTLQASLTGNGDDDSEWENITGSDTTLSGDGSRIHNIDRAFYHYVRVSFIVSGGSANITSRFNDKLFF